MVCNSILKNAAFDSAIVRNRGYKISIRNGCIFANYQVTVGCDGVPYVNGKKIIACWGIGAQGQSFVSVVIAPAVAGTGGVSIIRTFWVTALCDFEFAASLRCCGQGRHGQESGQHTQGHQQAE